MQAIPTPQEIEAAAERAGTSMIQVCKRAGIAYSTFWRWQCRGADMSSGRLQLLMDTIAEIGAERQSGEAAE